MELSRDPGEAELSRGVDAGELYHGAVALYERQVQGEHIGLRGEVEEQLARPEPHLPGEPVLDALLQIGIVGGPAAASAGSAVAGRSTARLARPRSRSRRARPDRSACIRARVSPSALATA